MNLVQKLPVGLAVACCMMMSSCSQEDVQVAQSKMESVATGPNAERGIAATPNLPTTNGPAGNNIFASGWQKKMEFNPFDPEESIVRPTGTSTQTALWGDQNFPWIKPLPIPPGSNLGNGNNFVTFITQSNVLSSYGSNSKVTSTIKNLTPGKKYAVTVSMATSSCTINGQPTGYAKAAAVHILGTISPCVNGVNTVFDFTEKESIWVTKTITFEAQDSEVTIYFQRWFNEGYYPTSDQYLWFMHGFVGKNAVVEVP